MFFDSIGMCFESMRMLSGRILMYFNCMQTCSESIPLHFALFKSIRMQFEDIRIYFEIIRMHLECIELSLYIIL